MNAHMRRGEAVFAPRARLLKLLGGELIRDDVMAVMELLKNAYDADATVVDLTVNAEDTINGAIIVRDNGLGMGVEELIGRWMQPGGSFKRRERTTLLGRVALGEKGVGRFAVDRLGSICELVSRRRGSDLEIVARFDWDAFDDETVPLEEIRSSWFERPAEVFASGSGTRITVSGLRQQWSRRDFRRLCRRMQRLRSPFHGEDGFEIRIMSDDFPDYSEEFAESFLDRSPYRLNAVFDGTSLIRFTFNGSSETIPAPTLHDWSCGGFSLNLHAFDLDTESIRRVGSVQAVRAWLRAWTGCAIYRDGFRVLPYGEPDDDWLRLDQRRVNNPVHRLGTSQIVGQVEIGGATNPGLIDQTNRGGLVENRAFRDMRLLVSHMVDYLEDRRSAIRHGDAESPDDDLRQSYGAEDPVEAAIRTVKMESRSASQKAGVAFAPMLEVVSRAYRRERQRIGAAQGGLFDMAGAGLSTGIVAKEMAGLAGDLDRSISGLEAELGLPTPVRFELQRIAAQMRDLADLTQRFGTAVRYRAGELDVRDELNSFVHSVGGIAGRLGVKTAVIRSEETLPLVSGHRDSLWQILSILLRNALEAFTDEPRREIRFSVSTDRSDPKFLVIRCADTGSGIEASNVDQIFSEGFSTKSGHSGLGLPVARNIADRMFRRDGVGRGTLVLHSRRWHGHWTVFALRVPAFRRGDFNS